MRKMLAEKQTWAPICIVRESYDPYVMYADGVSGRYRRVRKETAIRKIRENPNGTNLYREEDGTLYVVGLRNVDLL